MYLKFDNTSINLQRCYQNKFVPAVQADYIINNMNLIIIFIIIIIKLINLIIIIIIINQTLQHISLLKIPTLINYLEDFVQIYNQCKKHS